MALEEITKRYKEINIREKNSINRQAGKKGREY
jgi:hypothetical protein